MSLLATFKEQSSPKIDKWIQIADAVNLPAPFNNPIEFGKRSNISSADREIKNFSSNLTMGRIRIDTLDVGSGIATFLAGSYLTGKRIGISAVKFPDAPIGFFDGFIGDVQYHDGICTLECYDWFYNVRDAYFLFDYKNMGFVEGGVGFGTVYAINGTNLYMALPLNSQNYNYIRHPGRRVPGEDQEPVFDTIGDDPRQVGRRNTPWYKDNVRPIFRIEQDYENYITEANYLKFSSKNDYTGIFGDSREFDDIPSYQVSGGNILGTNEDTGAQIQINGYNVKIATFEIDSRLRGVKTGDTIYIRKPIHLAGNPAVIIHDLLYGNHTSLSYTTGTLAVEADSYATTASYCQNFDAFKEITDSSAGDVANEITSLAEEFFFDVYIDINGTVRMSPIRPHGNHLQTLGSYYNEQNSWNFQYGHSIDDAVYRIDAKYDFKEYTDQTLYDRISLERKSLKNFFNKRAIVKSSEFDFIHNPDEVTAVLSRELFWRRHGVTRWEWESPLFGMELELGSFTIIRTESFASGSHIVYVDSIGIDLGNNMVKLGGWDYSNCFLNFYIMEWQGNGTVASSVVSGTSNSGWARLDPEVTGSFECDFIVKGTAAGSLATVTVPYTISLPLQPNTPDFERCIGTNGFAYRKRRLLAATNAVGTFLYRYERLWGDAGVGIGGTIALCGTTWEDVVKCGYAIPNLTNEYDDFIGGTVENLSSNYGSVSIFW
jgi:hypothetical protein